MEERGDDGISALPDCMLVDILSRLPSTKDAIRTGTLSKRWQHLWTSVTTINFRNPELYDNLTPRRKNPIPMSDFVSSVDKTLTQCRQLKLKKFKVVCTSYDSRFESQVNNWIRYAISCNVEELTLKLWYSGLEVGFLLDEDIFTSSCFTNLTLLECRLHPTGAISWKNLKTLCISSANLDEDLIKNILFGSAVLETLELEYCDGYRRLDITSKSLKKLVVSGCIRGGNVIEINAPNILSLTIRAGFLLWKVLLLNVSSLVEANLDYNTMSSWEEEMLEGFIINLRHVKELNIGDFCSKAMSRLEAKGFVFPSNIKFHDDACNRSVENEDW